MFIAALVTIDKTWKQPNYPLTDEWIKNVVNICHGAVFRYEKEKFLICNNIDEPCGHNAKWNNLYRER